MTAAVKEKSKFCLFVNREIGYGQGTCESCIYARVTCRSGNSEMWQSLNNMACARRMSLSRTRLALQILNLAEITQ